MIEKNFFNNEYLSGFFELEHLRGIIKKLIDADRFSQMHPDWVALLKLFNHTIRQDSASFTKGWIILIGLLCLLEKDLLEEKNPGDKKILNFLKTIFPEPNNAEASAKLREFILRDDEGALASNIFLIQRFNRHNDNVITMKSGRIVCRVRQTLNWNQKKLRRVRNQMMICLSAKPARHRMMICSRAR